MKLTLLGTGAFAWIKTSNKDSICADAPDETTVRLGETGTKCTSETEAPEEYIELQVDGMATFDGDSATAYLTDLSKISTMEPRVGSTPITPAPKLETPTDFPGLEVGITRAGMQVGTADNGGFVGTASYLVTKGSISYNTNNFLIPGGEAKDVCVIGGAGTACGPKRTASAGDYKFSLYGYTEGKDFPTNMAKAENAKIKYIGFRQTVVTKNMGANVTVKINGGAYMSVADLADTAKYTRATDVSSIAIKGNKTELSLDFPKDFLAGAIEGGKPVIKETGKIVIHVLRVSQLDAGEFLINYLIPLTDTIKAKGATGAGPHSYFVYDPSVASSNKPKASSNAFTATISLLAAGFMLLL